MLLFLAPPPIDSFFYIAALYYAATILFGLCCYALFHRRETSAESFALAMLLGGIWEVCCVMQQTDKSLAHQVYWWTASELVSTLLALAWLVMILCRTGLIPRLTPLWRVMIGVAPCFTVVLALTSRYHHFYAYDFRWDQGGKFLEYAKGPWCYVDDASSYILPLASVVILARSFRRPGGATSRAEIALIALGVSLPIAADILYETGHSLVPGVNLASCTLLPSGLIAAWAIFRFGTFQVTPLVQGVLFENLLDPVLVIGPDDRLLHFNRVARDLLGISEVDIGRHGGDWGELLNHGSKKEVNSGEVVVEKADVTSDLSKNRNLTGENPQV